MRFRNFVNKIPKLTSTELHALISIVKLSSNLGNFGKNTSLRTQPKIIKINFKGLVVWLFQNVRSGDIRLFISTVVSHCYGFRLLRSS